MNEINEAWRRIETWLETNASAIHAGLASGATDAQITQAETDFGVVFPDDLKASLRVHNGEARDVGSVRGEELLSLDGMVAQWRVWEELRTAGMFAEFAAEADGPVKPNWWNTHWVPLTHNGGGDFQCLDLDPTEGGSPSQVIQMWHDWEQRKVLAPSFAAWFTTYADALEAGDYRLAGGGYLEETKKSGDRED